MILSIEKLQSICGISATVGAKSMKLEKCIEQAEDFDIKKVLGNSFYTTIDKTKSTYDLLLNGGNYTYDGVEYSFKGLNYAIAWFAFARWTKLSNSNPTAFGTVVKNSDYSDPVEERKLQKEASEYESAGVEYLEDVKLFLHYHYGNPIYDNYFKMTRLNDQNLNKQYSISVIGG